MTLKNKATVAFREVAATGAKAAGFGLFVANGLMGDVQSAEFSRSAGNYAAARLSAKP